ncbi:MAG: glycosyltransferase family 39 protein [Planctomycetaceae bacterium]|nr:glycosyltransferase family 39 protein [Planctomycetaceae bacterium]
MAVERDLSIRHASVMLGLILFAGLLLRLPGYFDPFGSQMEGWTGAFNGCMARNCLERQTLVPYLDPYPSSPDPVPYVNHPPLTAWIVAASWMVFGQSEWAARLPFLLCSLLSIGLAYRLGTRMGDRTSGIVAAACLATAPVAVVYGSQVEHVGSHLLLGILGLTLAQVDYLESPSPRGGVRLLAWMLFTLAADWPGFLYLIVLQACSAVRLPARRFHVLAWTAAGVAVLACLVVWLTCQDERFDFAHLMRKVHQRTTRLVTDSQGTGEGTSISLTQLLGRHLSRNWTLFSFGLTIPLVAWFVTRRRTRQDAIPIVLLLFGAVFYLVGSQGHYQHDYWSHPMAASYVFAAVGTIAVLRLSPHLKLWLTIMIAVANVSAIGYYREHVLPRRSGSTVANSHWQLAELMKAIPEEASLVIEEQSEWPTLGFYVGRNYATVADAKSITNVPADNGQRVRPWSSYLTTHKLVAPTAGQLLPDRIEHSQFDWLITGRSLDDVLDNGPVATSGHWRLYSLSSEIPAFPGERPAGASDVAAAAGAAPGGQLRQGSPYASVWLFQNLGIPVILLVCLLFPAARGPLVIKSRLILSRMTESRWAGPALAGTAGLALPVMIAVLTSLPVPVVHDEYGYLLTADTFAEGRLTNPNHPFWEHFESIHIFHQPVYQAKYPPGQGAVLALGQVVFGHPVFGVWLSLAAACAATAWALQAVHPRRWAALGGVLVALNPWIARSWGSAYHGGAVAMLGGALLYGGFLRFIRTRSAASAVALAAGAIVLANSRPWEGLIAFLPVAVLLVRHFCWNPLSVSQIRSLLPAVGVLAAGAAFIGFYNLQLTGHPGRLPYQHHERLYAVAPSFLWQDLRSEPEYRHDSIRRVHVDWERIAYDEQRFSLYRFALAYLWKLQLVWGVFLGPVLSIALVALPSAFRCPLVRYAALPCGLTAIALLGHTYMQPHYLAPIIAPLMTILVACLRRLSTLGYSARREGRFLVRAIVLVQLVTVPLFLSAHRQFEGRFDDEAKLELSFTTGPETGTGDYLIASARMRCRILDDLRARPGSHLVLVRYLPAHDPLFEWVYNRADIDRADVVWARDMGAHRNAELIDYYRDRRVWLLTIDGSLPKLTAWKRPSGDGPEGSRTSTETDNAADRR